MDEPVRFSGMAGDHHANCCRIDVPLAERTVELHRRDDYTVNGTHRRITRQVGAANLDGVDEKGAGLIFRHRAEPIGSDVHRVE